MKKLLIPAAIAAALTIPSAFAATTIGSTFNVTVALTSQCSATTVGTPVVAFGAYTAFGGAVGPVAVSAPITFSCTRNLPITAVAFDTASASDGLNGGVVSGLQYTLTAPVDTPTLGTAATPTSIGSGDTHSYTFSGTLPAGQAGDPTQNPSPAVRQLTITF